MNERWRTTGEMIVLKDRIEESRAREEVRRKNVEFKTQDGVTLAAWHCLPDQNSGKV
jgi:hypothetical protein